MSAQEREQLSPTALTIDQAARMLGVPAGTIRAHVDAGLPTNADGTVNLVAYAAWLIQRSHAE